MRRLAAVFGEQRQDLSCLVLVQVPFLAVSLFLAKTMAARHAYPDAPLRSFATLLPRVLPYDLLFLALICLAALFGRRMAPVRARGFSLALIYLAFALAMAVHFVHAGFFMYFGAPLSVDLVALAPDMAAYADNVITLESRTLAQLLAVCVASSLLLTPAAWRAWRPRLVRDDRTWRPAAWAAAAALAAAGLALALTPVGGYRERALRRLAASSLVIPVRAAPPGVLTARHRAVLEAALGPERAEGAAAFQSLPRRRRNVLIWVMESVGERFMRSHHPLGEAPTPVLDGLAARGSVRFSHVYAQAPLSAQTDWALMTGMPPAPSPSVFKSATQPLPPHGPMLPAVFGAAGYRTAFISSSYLDSWGETRFLRTAGLDLLEDMRSLANRSRYERDTWSIDGSAVVDRFLDWVDGGGSERPFFAILWNVESHHPYTWVGMPAALRKADDYTRYLGAIGRADALLGRVHDGLSSRALASDTLIVVVGDHGQGLGRGDRPHDRIHSLLLTEDDLQVPLVFLHPELPVPGNIVDSPATHKDLYPTLLDLTGLAAVPGIEGVSLARPYRPSVLLARAISRWPTSVRAGRYKLVQDLPGYPPELYDVVADTWETSDVSMARREVTDALLAYLRWTDDRERGRAEATAPLPLRVAQPDPASTEPNKP